MQVLESGDSFHDPNGNCDLLRIIGGKMNRRQMSPKRMEESDKDICEVCFPNLAEET